MSKEPSTLKTTLAGGFGGACLVLVGHPLDTIKVRIQTMPRIAGEAAMYTSTWDCATKIIAKEGPMGLYKGIIAPLLGVTPMYSFCFMGYKFGKDIFLKEDSMKNLDLTRIGLAGATSGIFTTPILAPLERIKCVLQIQGASHKAGEPLKYPGGVFDTGKRILSEGGITSVNRGFMATMLRDSVASFFYFSSYEYFKFQLRPASGELPAYVPLIAGGIAGIFNWLGCLPIDTLKSKYQVAPEGKYPNGIRSVFKEILATDGFISLYRGFGAVMIRAFPANAACFYGYEMALQFLTSIGMD